MSSQMRPPGRPIILTWKQQKPHKLRKSFIVVAFFYLPLYLPKGIYIGEPASGREPQKITVACLNWVWQTGRIKASLFVRCPSAFQCFGMALQKFVHPVPSLSHLPVNCLLSLGNPLPLPPFMCSRVAYEPQPPHVFLGLLFLWEYLYILYICICIYNIHTYMYHTHICM